MSKLQKGVKIGSSQFMKNQIVRFTDQKLKFALKKKTRSASKFNPETYINSKDPSLKFYNLTIPTVRFVMAEIENELKSFSDQQKFEIFQELWLKANSFEAMAIALFWCENQSDEFLLANIKHLSNWVEKINNWAHSDTYSGILARLFELSPQTLLATFAEWNKHKNEWKRRNSIVGIYYYSRMRKSTPTFNYSITQVKNLMDSPEYYVQKGVGWTLREIYNVYPSKTIQFLEQNVAKITPQAWTAATEKLPKKIKQKLLTERKAKRVSKTKTSKK